MAAPSMSYVKTPSDQNVTIWIGSGNDPLGIADASAPTAAEINNTAGSGMVNASPSISWNDFDFGFESSETTTEPSLADVSTYEDFGAANFGGSMSFFMPQDYDDNSNTHSIVYDLTDTLGESIDIVKRIDGATKTTVPAADGDFVSVFRTKISGETNPFAPGESVRRTVPFTNDGDFAHYTIIGTHTITAVAPSSFAEGDKGRIRGIVQDRDYTNALDFTSSDANVVEVSNGGFYRVVGTGTATVTLTDREAGTSTTVEVTVA